ncbi:MAG TPA: hypothetical protein VH816_06185 [Gaiellaceae bacterium]
MPELALAPIQLLIANTQLVLAHGGIPGLIAETGSVFVALGVFGYFIRRSAKKEREREEKSDRERG